MTTTANILHTSHRDAAPARRQRMMRLAIVPVLIGLLLASSIAAAQVCTTQTIGNKEFLGISGSSDTNIIGVAKKGTIYRYDGTTWIAMSSPTNQDLRDVEVVDGTSAFAVGRKGTVLRLVSGSWVTQSVPTDEDLNGVWADASGEAWAAGKDGAILYYDGTSWSDVSAAAGTDKTDLTDIWGDGASVYVLSDKGELYRYDRNTGTWDAMDDRCEDGKGFEDLWGDAGGNIYLVKKKDVYLHDGSSCAVTASSNRDLIGIHGAGSQVYAAGKNGSVLHYDGSSWVQEIAGGDQINDVWVSSRGNAYYAGKAGSITTCINATPVFVINHDNYGIHCLAETITVNAEDASGNALTSYGEQVTLDTQTGNGTWSLVSGGGTFVDATADDGIATYDWPLGENSAVFSLDYTQGTPVFDIDVYQTNDPTIRDNDVEGTIRFSASGFTLTAAPLSNPPPALIVPFVTTQTAGTDFALYLAAYGQTPNDPACGVIESYTGAQNLKFWFGWVDPATGAVAPTIDGAGIAANEAGAAAQAVTFSNGQAAVTAKYKDAGLLQLFVKDDSLAHPDLPTGIRGATAAFVVKPAYFGLSNIEDGATNANPAAADASGPVFVGAGEPFSVTVTAYDAENDVTPNFGQESAPETVRLASSLVAPAGGNDPGLSPATAFGPFAAGTATGTTFAWPEVGIITLQPSVGDGDYLGGGDVVGTASGNVGRFIPTHFTAGLNAPLFATQCGGGSFTYIGQPFDYTVNPVITVTAQAAGGTTTQNYTGAFFKISNLTLLNRTYSASTGTLDLSGLPSTAVDPAIADVGGGSGTLLFDLPTGISILRGAAEPAFDADIDLSIEIFDADGVTTLAAPIAFSPIGFDNGPAMRYGRVRIINAIGSELVNLAVPMRSEYFVDAATGFVSHFDDACSNNVTLSLGSYTENLGAGETCAIDSGTPGDSGIGCPGPAGQRYREPPLAGDFNLFLQAPGSGNDGSVNVSADVPAWLEFDWDASVPGLEDPTGTATFGIYDGEGKRIYMREVY
ncbi:MAG: hypothetical protein KJP17_12590 [Gammaproteobacteria bacterium]|nr:hypothetical protein [Gammaproteobacteria bacterium]